MVMTTQRKQRALQYEKTLIEFAAKEDGYFFLVSHDVTFLNNTRNFLNKELIIGTDRILGMMDVRKFLEELKNPDYKEKKILLLVERILNGKNMLSFIKQIKTLFNNVMVIVITTEVEKNVLVLLHEVGADSFITKPFSINTLVEKVAFVIKPQGKIGQLLDKAKLYLARKKFEEAISLADKVLEIKPGSAAGLMVKGDALKGLDRMDEAVASYEEAADNAPMYLEPLKKLAALYRDKGDLDAQLTYLERLDQLSPLNVDRKVDMGEIHVTFGNKDKAENLFDDAVRGATKDAMDLIEDVKRNIAERCMDKDPKLSEKFFRSILDAKGAENLQKRDIEVFNRLGIALRRQGRWKDAVTEYEKALKISPNDENLHFNMAMALSDGGVAKRAVQSLEKVLKINPDFYAKSALLSFNVGVMYYNANQYPDAVKYLKHTLSLDPSHQGAKRIMANIAKNGG